MTKASTYDPALIRVLMFLNEKHPDPLGTVAIFGDSADVRAIIELVKVLGFNYYCSKTEIAFVEYIQLNQNILFVLIAGKSIPNEISSALSEACERTTPLYIAVTFSTKGKDPDTGKHYKSIFHRFDSVSQTPAAVRVAEATRQLYKRANEEALATRPISENLQACLLTQQKSE